MKLIYIDTARLPTEKAHGYQICKMCEEFGAAGLEVILWVPSRDNEIKQNIYEYYGLKNNFKIVKLPSLNFLNIRKISGKLEYWLRNYLFFFSLLFKGVARDALIYTRVPEIAFMFSLKGNKVIFESHTWPESKRKIFKFFARKSDLIITITEALKKVYTENGFLENKILVAPDGVDLEKFDLEILKDEARRKINLPLDKKIIIYTGHLYNWKGAQVLADAAKFLSDNELIVFVGGTPKDLSEFKEKNKEKRNILIVGQKSHMEIPFYLKAADILILPNKKGESISEKYTSPLKLFEYMASGRPIVASDLPSIREILSEKNCLFFRPNDANDLAEKIKNIINNKELADKIAEQGYLDAKNYTWEKRAKDIIEFIN